MAVKQRIPEVLRESCLDLFRKRWPNEDPIEINAYKLMKLTGLASGTCLKIFNNPCYVPDYKVMDSLCAFFNLQPGDFLYYEPDIEAPPENSQKVEQIA